MLVEFSYFIPIGRCRCETRTHCPLLCSVLGELFTEAAEGATEAMKGRLASQFFALAEEAWAQVEE